MAEHVLRGVVKHLLAAAHHHQPVRVLRHVFHAVGHEDDGHAAVVLQAVDQVQDLIPSSGIQSGGGLVQDQHFRPHGEHAGDGHSSLLAAGQLERRLLIILFLQAHQFQRFPGSCRDLVLRKAHVLRSETHVGEDIDLEELVLGVLEHEAHFCPELLHVVALGVDVLAIVIDGAAAGPQQSVQMLDQRGLAGAGVADEAHELPVRDLKVHILQRVLLKCCSLPVDVGQVFRSNRHVICTPYGHCRSAPCRSEYLQAGTNCPVFTHRCSPVIARIIFPGRCRLYQIRKGSSASISSSMVRMPSGSFAPPFFSSHASSVT